MTTSDTTSQPGARRHVPWTDCVRHTFSMRVAAPEVDAPCVGRFRRVGGAKVASWGLSPLVDDIELLISELVTNAMTHGTGCGISLALSVTRDTLLMDVTDGSRARPRVRGISAEAENGRGMIIVEDLADDWGVSEDGTSVWCLLTLPGARRPE